MAQEHRVIGPPGTGKTSFIRSQIEHWVEGGEYRPADFALTSYTRASAAVLRGRIDVPPEQAATLHSLCWHALGRPELAEVGKNAAAWNAQTPYAEWHVGSQKATALDEQIDSWSGPNALGQYNLGRAMMLSPQHPMLASVKTFVERWEAWKYENDFMDFQDLIDRGRRDITACPGDPAVLICDEAQDFVPAQWELVRKWGDHTDRFIVAGDPAQSLYSFAGSRPDEFLSPLPEENIRHLKQSHRLPQRVQHHAEQVLSNHILKLPPREYAPRDEAGAVRYLPGGFYTAGTVLDDVAEQLERGRSCMLLTTCNYMTKMYVREMRERGMLFHNPYRVSAGQWNPLGGDRREGSTRTLDRLLTYLKAPWTPDEARSVIEMLGASVFARHGVRAKLVRGEIDLPVNEAGQTWVGSWSDLLTEEAWVKWACPRCTLSEDDFAYFVRGQESAHQKCYDVHSITVETLSGETCRL